MSLAVIRVKSGSRDAGLRQAVRDPAQVLSAVLAALAVREQPETQADDMLARFLAQQQLLLVLDNCEHVIAAAAELCAGLLTMCDDVRVLATSREPLAVSGEARYRLAPLSLPGPDTKLEESEAVALFANRARSVDAQFTLNEETAPAVAQLVARLDGMPLAIELAAARVEALGVEQLIERLDDRFRLLVGTDRLAQARQQSLTATADWSYRLLSKSHQKVFRAPPRKGPDGRARYPMLETLRAYGAMLLVQAGEQEAFIRSLAW